MSFNRVKKRKNKFYNFIKHLLFGKGLQQKKIILGKAKGVCLYVDPIYNFQRLTGVYEHEILTHFVNWANVNIENALKASNKTFASLKEVLDMPSGHGRVLRLLVTKVSPERVTACDIDADGINFCKNEFGCKKFLSSQDISKIQFPVNYSLIWVGSLFTHINKKAFSNLLSLLFNSLEPDGVLVFTTQGKYSVEIFEKYWVKQPVPVSNEQLQKELEKTNGFYFAQYANSEDYGVSISLKHYVLTLIESLFENKAKVVMYK